MRRDNPLFRLLLLPVFMCWFLSTDALSGVEPTDYEQLHLEAINYARSAPLSEAARLGIDLNEGPPETFLASSSRQPLAFNTALVAAARLHVLDMLTNNYFSHYSLNGDAPWDRMTKQGYNYSYAGENIAWRGSTGVVSPVSLAIQLHDDLFVDRGVAGRGHRVNIMNNDFKEIGVGFACGPYVQSGITYNVCMVADDFGTAMSPRPIVTGVVYDDKDGNGRYGVGEGLGAVIVRSFETGDFTTTFASGGYSLPLPAGMHALTFQHTTLGTVTKSVNLFSENVKVDIKKTDFSTSSVVLLSSNQNSSMLFPGQRLVITIGSQPISISSGISIHFSYGFGVNQTVYAVILTPWNTLYFMTGTNRLQEDLAPYTQGAGRLIDLAWPNMRELDGEYVVLVVVTPAGADPLNMQTWLDYEIVRFNATRHSIVCTMDVMQCPDGSYVSRQPPDCAFAPCPAATK